MAMKRIIIEIMVEVLSILAIATKEIKRPLAGEFILERYVTLNSLPFSEILQEAYREERNRNCAAEVGRIDAGGGSDGASRAPKGCPRYQAFVIFYTSSKPCESSSSFTGNQLRDDLRIWLSPPEPSTNHNNACDSHYEGTAEWFLQGCTFREWKSSGSFLWIHGKRT
jgi:hypothetical protein